MIVTKRDVETRTGSGPKHSIGLALTVVLALLAHPASAEGTWVNKELYDLVKGENSTLSDSKKENLFAVMLDPEDGSLSLEGQDFDFPDPPELAFEYEYSEYELDDTAISRINCSCDEATESWDVSNAETESHTSDWSLNVGINATVGVTLGTTLNLPYDAGTVSVEGSASVGADLSEGWSESHTEENTLSEDFTIDLDCLQGAVLKKGTCVGRDGDGNFPSVSFEGDLIASGRVRLYYTKKDYSGIWWEQCDDGSCKGENRRWNNAEEFHCRVWKKHDQWYAGRMPKHLKDENKSKYRCQYIDDDENAKESKTFDVLKVKGGDEDLIEQTSEGRFEAPPAGAMVAGRRATSVLCSASVGGDRKLGRYVQVSNSRGQCWIYADKDVVKKNNMKIVKVKGKAYEQRDLEDLLASDEERTITVEGTYDGKPILGDCEDSTGSIFWHHYDASYVRSFCEQDRGHSCPRVPPSSCPRAQGETSDDDTLSDTLEQVR